MELRFGASVFHRPKDVSHMMAPSALKLPNKAERAVETDAGRGDAAAAEATIHGRESCACKLYL